MPRDLSLAEIFQLGYYWETKILLTAVKLELFTVLADGQLAGADVAARLQADERIVTMLLNALVAMRVLTKVDKDYANSPVARAHLVKGRPGYVGHLLSLHEAEWNNWGKLADAVRTGRSPATQHVFRTDPELGANVLTVLDRIGQQSSPALARRLRLEGARTMLDVGGGAGTSAIAFCQAYPDLHATVFDLPDTLRTASRVVAESGLGERITLLPGDFNRDALGETYDVILMSDILHYQDDRENAALVSKCFAHLRGGGRLIVKDRFLSEDGTSPAWVTAFALHIFVNTERGRCYTVSEATRWMQLAGFSSVTEVEQTAVIQGVKAS